VCGKGKIKHFYGQYIFSIHRKLSLNVTVHQRERGQRSDWSLGL